MDVFCLRLGIVDIKLNTLQWVWQTSGYKTIFYKSLIPGCRDIFIPKEDYLSLRDLRLKRQLDRQVWRHTKLNWLDKLKKIQVVWWHVRYIKSFIRLRVQRKFDAMFDIKPSAPITFGSCWSWLGPIAYTKVFGILYNSYRTCLNTRFDIKPSAI